MKNLLIIAVMLGVGPLSRPVLGQEQNVQYEQTKFILDCDLSPSEPKAKFVAAFLATKNSDPVNDVDPGPSSFEFEGFVRQFSVEKQFVPSAKKGGDSSSDGNLVLREVVEVQTTTQEPTVQQGVNEAPSPVGVNLTFIKNNKSQLTVSVMGVSLEQLIRPPNSAEQKAFVQVEYGIWKSTQIACTIHYVNPFPQPRVRPSINPDDEINIALAAPSVYL